MVNMKKSTLAALVGVTAIVAAGVLGTPRSAHAQSRLAISGSRDAASLANLILNPNSGITISNPTYTGADISARAFSGGLTSGLPIDQGIILSTGDAVDAANPSSFQASTATNTDAASLQFDFTLPSGSDSLLVNYLFATEEIPNPNVTPSNDEFAIFVDGQDIARIPGANTPVTVNNLNSSGRLIDNTTATTNLGAAQNNVAYNALTNPLTATISGLAPGQHTIQFAIADTEFNDLDSAVFIQAGSFSTTAPQAVPEPSSTLGILAVGALGAGRVLKRRVKKAAVKAD